MSNCRYKDNYPDNWPDNWPDNSPDNWPDNNPDNAPDNCPDNWPDNHKDNGRVRLSETEQSESARMNIRGGRRDQDEEQSPRMRIYGRERTDEEEAVLAVLGSRRTDLGDGDGVEAAINRSPCGRGVQPLSGCEGAQGRDCRPKYVGPCEKRVYRKCVNPDCTCALYPADCRNRFWPDFAKPRWLPCSDLYCSGGCR